MGPDISFPQPVRSIWALIWNLQNLRVRRQKEEEEEESELQWEVNRRGDQKEMPEAVICSADEKTSNPLAGL